MPSNYKDEWPRCRVCGDPFWPTRPDQLYCSQRCHSRTRALKRRACKHCGEGFKPARSARLYCSRQCANEARIIMRGDLVQREHMTKMQAVSATMRRHRAMGTAVDQILKMTPEQAFMEGYRRGRKAGYYDARANESIGTGDDDSASDRAD